MPDLAADLALLRDPATIRVRSHALLARALDGRSDVFTADVSRLPAAADYVARVIRQAYPSLRIPYHARWRHFAAGGRDRWEAMAATLPDHDAAGIARIRFDLCVVSVLLDAGAGPAWRFVEPDGTVLTRSEGLAVASLHAFRAGLFSGGQGARADAAGLRAVTPEALGLAFQVRPDNPLAGLEGRAALLRSLGNALAARPDLFGPDGRIGCLFDALTQYPAAAPASASPANSPRPSTSPTGTTPASAPRPGAPFAGTSPASAPRPGAPFAGTWPASTPLPGTPSAGTSPASAAWPGNGTLPATAILAAVLDGFGPAWPPRLALEGHALGDVWRHPAVEGPGHTDGLIPFHKLSQWLTYSLVEVVEDAGLRVTGLGALTGLPEYRNGGLFLDLGVLTLRDPALAAQALPVDHPAIVEWRALTVALLDRIADPIRAALGRTAAELPLARILEGGTWAAGRQIARERRPDGGPPLSVQSDGTVF